MTSNNSNEQRSYATPHYIKKDTNISYEELYNNEMRRRINAETILEQYKLELEQLNKILNENTIKIDKLKQNLETKDKVLKQQKKTKGSQCSINGNQYEKTIHNITTHSYINEKPFNTQKVDELAGSSFKNDIECNFNGEKDIGIEIKKYNTPDWMQCVIKYNKETKHWEATNKGKTPIECRNIFNKLINEINIYNGDIPPFMEKSITHEEWVKIKSETTKWNDIYIDIPSDCITKLYSFKKCNYIQISNGYGLYHLGSDICKFDVPLFNIEQQIRIRTKIHTRMNKKGFCNISVTAACQPKDITKIKQSKYSLDNKAKLPVSLIYKY